MIRIVTDSTCDLPLPLVEAHRITVVPAYVNIGTRSIRDDIQLKRSQFYADLAGFDPYPTTSAPAPGEFGAVYEQLTREGATQILSIHVASTLSGILNAARSGGEMAESAPITFIDSRQLSRGLGFQVLAAARLAGEGQPPAAIAAALEEQAGRTRVFCVLEALDALQRSGRVSRFAAGVGNMLQVKPIIQVYDGEVTAVERVRTQSRALRQLVAHSLAAGRINQIAFLNTNTTAVYQQLLELLTPDLPHGVTPVETIACPAIGVHVGAGAVGVVLVVDP